MVVFKKLARKNPKKQRVRSSRRSSPHSRKSMKESLMTTEATTITLLPETAVTPQAQPAVTPRVAVNGNLPDEDTRPEIRPELRVANIPDAMRKKYGTSMLFVPVFDTDKPAIPAVPPEYEQELQQAISGLEGLRYMPGMEAVYQNAVANIVATLREKHGVKDLGDVMAYLSDHPEITNQVARVSALTRQLQAELWTLGDNLKDTNFRVGNVRVESDLRLPIMLEERKGKRKTKGTTTASVTPEDLYKNGLTRVYFTHDKVKFHAEITDGKVRSAKGGVYESFNLWLKDEYPAQHVPSAYVAVRVVCADGTVKKLDEIRDAIK